MPGPTLTFGFVIATLLGSGFHLLAGGDARRLGLYLLSGWTGFAIGHFVGSSLNINVFNVGSLHFLTAIVGSMTMLVFSNLLSRNRGSHRTIR